MRKFYPVMFSGGLLCSYMFVHTVDFINNEKSLLMSLGELFEEATRKDWKNNFHVVSSVPLPGRPSYLSQPGLADPKCFQMSSSSNLSPSSPDHTPTPPPHPSAPCSPLTEPPHGRTAPQMTSEQLTPINLHIWSPLRRRQSERERMLKRMGWGFS